MPLAAYFVIVFFEIMRAHISQVGIQLKNRRRGMLRKLTGNFVWNLMRPNKDYVNKFLKRQFHILNVGSLSERKFLRLVRLASEHSFIMHHVLGFDFCHRLIACSAWRGGQC